MGTELRQAKEAGWDHAVLIEAISPALAPSELCQRKTRTQAPIIDQVTMGVAVPRGLSSDSGTHALTPFGALDDATTHGFEIVLALDECQAAERPV